MEHALENCADFQPFRGTEKPHVAAVLPKCVVFCAAARNKRSHTAKDSVRSHWSLRNMSERTWQVLASAQNGKLDKALLTPKQQPTVHLRAAPQNKKKPHDRKTADICCLPVVGKTRCKPVPCYLSAVAYKCNGNGASLLLHQSR